MIAFIVAILLFGSFYLGSRWGAPSIGHNVGYLVTARDRPLGMALPDITDQ